MSEPVIRTSSDPARACAEHISASLTAAIAERGRASWAVCGGSTPAPTYHALALSTVDWSRVDLFFGDERCVPPDHIDSTFGLLTRELLERLPDAGPTVHRMRGEDPDYSAAARDYGALLPERLDLAFLGMGPDGHTASLFPGDAAAVDLSADVIHVVGPKPPPNRLSLTPRSLGAARERVVLVTGAGKAPLVAQVLTGPWNPLDLPAQVARDGTWYLDPAAAAELDSH